MSDAGTRNLERIKELEAELKELQFIAAMASIKLRRAMGHRLDGELPIDESEKLVGFHGALGFLNRIVRMDILTRNNSQSHPS